MEIQAGTENKEVQVMRFTQARHLLPRNWRLEAAVTLTQGRESPERAGGKKKCRETEGSLGCGLELRGEWCQGFPMFDPSQVPI